MLNQYSREANLLLLFDYNVVKDYRTSAVKGVMTAGEALCRMLRHIELTFDAVSDRTLAVTVLHGKQDRPCRSDDE